MKVARALLAGCASAIAAALAIGATYAALRCDPQLAIPASHGMLVDLSAPRWSVLVPCVLLVPAVSVAYGAMFELVTRRAGILCGAALGAVHAVVAWLVIGLVPHLLPNVGMRFADTFFVLYNNVIAIAGFVLAHMGFGAVIGALYGRPRRARCEHAPARWTQLHATQAADDRMSHAGRDVPPPDRARAAT